MSTPLDEFAEARALPVHFLKEHGVRLCPSDGEKPGWIGLPYWNLTGTWYSRYRNPDPEGQPKYWGRPGSGVHLYNPLRLGPNADKIVFTEGEIDCLTLVYLGFPAIGIPGTGNTERFRGAWKLLFDGAWIVVAMDGDQAGRAASSKLLDAFEPNATVLDVPDGMDLNDWLLNDPEALIGAVRASLNT